MEKEEKHLESPKDETLIKEVFQNFRMYHQLQYDRIGKIEARREVFSKFVITISTGIYLIGFRNLEDLNILTGVFLPILEISEALIRTMVPAFDINITSSTSATWTAPTTLPFLAVVWMAITP